MAKSKDSFEESLKELQAILTDLENSKIPLADVVVKYQRAQECLKDCRSKLEEAEMKIKKLSKEGNVEEFALE